MRRRDVTVVVGLALLLAGANAAQASAQTDPEGKDAGDVVVVDPVNVNRELRSGDSTTLFSLRLPEGAECQGDTANDDWRVQSFLVPVGTDIGSLRYRATRPDGEQYRSLRYLDGDIFAMEATDPNPSPGLPGRIVDIPLFTFAYYESGSLALGDYKMGIACTEPTWFVERFWDVDVRLIAAPEVEPGGLRWQVIDPPADVQSPSTERGAPWLPLVFGLAAAGAAVLFLRRRSRSSAPPSSPPSSTQRQKEPA